MALVHCPECRGPVSTEAEYCPRCGYPMGSTGGGRGPSAPPPPRAPAYPSRARLRRSRFFGARRPGAAVFAAGLFLAALLAAGVGWALYRKGYFGDNSGADAGAEGVSSDPRVRRLEGLHLFAFDEKARPDAAPGAGGMSWRILHTADDCPVYLETVKTHEPRRVVVRKGQIVERDGTVCEGRTLCERCVP